MARPGELATFRRLFLVLLGGMLVARPASVLGEEGDSLAPPAVPVRTAAPPVAQTQQLLERLGKLEQRLDGLTQQNDTLRRENQALTDRSGTQSPDLGSPASPASPAGPTTLDGPDSPDGPAQPDGLEDGSGTTGQAAGPGDLSPARSAPAAGGGSKASGGGDPTTIGRAQEIGNQHLGKVGTNPSYDFDNGGFRVETPDGEWSFGIAGMTQLDGMAYSRPTPGPVTSSGFYNPRSRIYFEGLATKPISWEFSFQNFYDTVALLDAYLNFNYDPRFEVRIGRYKAPFGYEFYRIHIWDLLAPERSLWANNYEANRRFGAMLWGVLAEQRIEYALGSFDSQRNSLRPFNSRQDFLGFVNFKPFYPAAQGFLLRDLQLGGSVDLGNENQTPVPAVLRTDQSPGGAVFNSTAASNAAGLPFLAFNPAVVEKGGRALWEAHLAYYYGGLSLISALEGGHESYASRPAAPPVHVPVNGWFVQTGYILTGETIRDRTLLQPLHPFDLRRGRFGLGAWELTARYSYLQLGHQVFTSGLADPTLWSNRAQMVDAGANWYLNQFVKVYFDWEHAFFGNPVTATGGAFRRSNDLYWLRTQLYF